MLKREFIFSREKYMKYTYTNFSGNLQLYSAFLQQNKSNLKNLRLPVADSSESLRILNT